MTKQLDMFAPRPKEKEPEPEKKRNIEPDSGPLHNRGFDGSVLTPQPPPKWATDEWFLRDDDPRDDRDLLPCGKPWPFPKPRRTRCELCGEFDVYPKPLIIWLGGLVHVHCHEEYMRKKKRQEAREQGKPFCVVCGEPFPEPGIPTFDGMIHFCCQEDYEHGGAGSTAEGRDKTGGGAGPARVSDEAVRSPVLGPENDSAAGGGEPGSVEVQGGGRQFSAEEEKQREWPTCVICGSAEGHSKIWVDSMYELAPGVHRGVCHRSCFERLLRDRERSEENGSRATVQGDGGSGRRDHANAGDEPGVIRQDARVDG